MDEEENGPEQSASHQTFLVDINSHFTDKVRPGDRRFWDFNMTFQTYGLTLPDLARSVRCGYAWTAPHVKQQQDKGNGKLTTYRVKANVAFTQLLGLDSDTEDQRSTFDAWLADPFVAQYGAFLHTTASHTPDAPRCRVVFLLDQELAREDAEVATRALLWRYPACDQSAKDASRIFYGAKGCDVRMLGQTLPVAILWRDVVEPYLAHAAGRDAQRKAEHAQRLAERRRRGATGAGADQVTRYVASLLDRTLAGVEQTQEGTGQRHQLLRDAAVRLYSVRFADWLTEDAGVLLEDLELDLLAAARANGYAGKYGEDATLRTISSGADLAEPADLPAFAVHFRPGDCVTVRHGGQQLAAGVIQRMRQADGTGWWEAQVASGADAGAWYPRDWLTHVATHVAQEGYRTQQNAPGSASRVTDISDAIVTPEQGAERLTAPPEEPPGWWEDTLASVCYQSDTFAFDDNKANAVLVIQLPAGAWLADLLDADQLPARCILDANTGTGKTTWAASQTGTVLVVMSGVVAIQQQAERWPDAGVWYEKDKRLGRVTFVTYEGFPACVKQLLEDGTDPAGVRVFVDEQHNLALAGYRHEALRRLVTTLSLHDWRQVVFMSGTPLDIPHPYLADFTRVTVDSERRTQKAVMVRWKRDLEDGHEGRRVDTVAQLVMRHTSQGGRVVVHLNDKGTGLDRLVAALRAAGVGERHIYRLNADSKYESIGQYVIQHEDLPEDCRVLIVTDVLVESANLRTDLAAVVFCDTVHPAHAQQLLNRQRGDVGPGVAYVLTTGTGAGRGLDLNAEMVHTLACAQQQVDALNALEDRRRAYDDQARHVFAGQYGRLVCWDKQSERYAVDHLGVAYHVHDSVTRYCASNPAAFRNWTRRWNWQWDADEELVVTPADKTPAQVDREKELANDYAQLAREDWLGRVAHAAQITPEQAEVDLFAFEPPPKVKRVLERALALNELLAEDGPGNTWKTACALLATGRDSTQSYHRTRDLVAAAQLRQAGDAFVEDLVGAFELDRPYTQQERHQLLVSVYERHPHMRPYVTPVYKFTWSEEASVKLDERQADRVLSLLFTVHRTRERRDSQQVRLWTFTGTDPLKAQLDEGLARLEEALAQHAPAGVEDTPTAGSMAAETPQSERAAVPPKSGVIKAKVTLVAQATGEGTRPGEDLRKGWASMTLEERLAFIRPATGKRW